MKQTFPGQKDNSGILTRKARHVTVIGGGVVGMATAYALARRGHRVTVLEAESGPAMRTSYANGAQLSYVYTDALANAALWKSLPKLALGRDPSFRMRVSLSPAFLSWLAKFTGQMNSRAFERNTLAVLALAEESRQAMENLLTQHPIAFSYERPGKLHLYENATSYAAAQRIMTLKARYGVQQFALNPQEAVMCEPALENVAQRLAGAIHSPGEEVGDPFQFTRAVSQLLRDDYDIALRYRARVKRLKQQGHQWVLTLTSGEELVQDDVVLCTGPEANQLLRPLGLPQLIQAMKGYSITAPLGKRAPLVSITDTPRKIVFARLGDRMRIAGLAEIGVSSSQVEPNRLATLVRLAREALPEAADYDAITDHWAGLRPMTPNSQPIISHPRTGLYLNCGHGMLGWTLAMGSAERVARMFETSAC
ncbi:FAD-dependent oxidoreductase [Altericroceibacterium spongiae]|uniref:FAD-dependent oxidoreductase n=1 Tax=Altericroceibacterium spongiae TaxID=2320269 RepID=UPI0016044C42|nr:FAD-dependent oxidoreductase [Altericroceibacterium spongiae]